MRFPAILAGLLMLAVALAGCSDDGSKPTGEEPPITVGPVKEGKGVIIGVVFDDSIRPVVGATVTLVGHDLTTKTDEVGAFAFKDLDPGAYFVKASKPGYREAQQNVDVVADVDNPELAKLLLEIDPETTPYYQGPFKWDFFYECTVGTYVMGSWGSATCGTEDWSDPFGTPSNYAAYEVDSTPTFVQTEVYWEGAGDVGSTMMIQLWVPDESASDGRDEYAIAWGSSPVVVQANATLLQEKNVGPDTGLQLALWASGTDEEPASLFLNQEVSVFTTVFYNMMPPEGWSVEDGDPPMPE